LIAASLFLWSGLAGYAQNAEKYRARLSVYPIASANSRNTVDGIGSASATLAGATLSITGKFEGLKSAATEAKVHQGTLMGVRGPAFANLTVTPAAQGSISGTVVLTPQQLDGLRKGHVYIQIYSTGAPDGNLWGWLVK
jgi:hypothetical protein